MQMVDCIEIQVKHCLQIWEIRMTGLKSGSKEVVSGGATANQKNSLKFESTKCKIQTKKLIEL